MNAMSDICYLCGKDKFSMEHVPAKCFFPEGSEYRKDLIKVPSCKKHNEDTSKDDEYVRNIICMSIGNNSIAFNQFIDKVLESFQHSPALKSQTFQKVQQVYIKGRGQNIKPVLSFQIDRERFDKVMKKIAYALYYHEYGEVWQRGLFVATEFLLDNNMQQDEFGEMIQEIKPQLVIPEFDGENPKVFQYKFRETTTEDVILWMKFYEGFEVFVVPNTNTSRPDSI